MNKFELGNAARGLLLMNHRDNSNSSIKEPTMTSVNRVEAAIASAYEYEGHLSNYVAKPSS